MQLGLKSLTKIALDNCRNLIHMRVFSSYLHEEISGKTLIVIYLFCPHQEYGHS